MNWTQLTDNSIFATPVVLALVAEHGTDVVFYEPETIRECLKQHNPSVSESVVTRVNAALGLFTSNAFWQDPATFNIVCRALNRSARPMAAPADIEDMAWGVTEAEFLLFDPEDDDYNATNVASSSVVKYVTVALNREGMYTTPDALKFAHPIRPSGLIDMPDQLLSLQQRSDDQAFQINQNTSNQLALLLQQILDARIPLESGALDQVKSSLAQLR